MLHECRKRGVKILEKRGEKFMSLSIMMRRIQKMYRLAMNGKCDSLRSRHAIRQGRKANVKRKKVLTSRDSGITKGKKKSAF